MATGRVTRVHAVAGAQAATGTGAGAGSAALKAAMQTAASGAGTGVGSASVQASMLMSATGTGIAVGRATAYPSITVTTSGTSNSGGSASSSASMPLIATGAGVGAGAATLNQSTGITTTGNSTGSGTADITHETLTAAAGTGTGTGAATLRRVVNMAYWRNLQLTADVLNSPYSATVFDSPWSATVEAPIMQISTATSDYIVIRIRATQPLNMNPPLIGVGTDRNYPTRWEQGVWVQNSPGQLTYTDRDGTTRYYRDAQLLVGPVTDINAQINTTPGRHRIYWDLTDVPSHIVEIAGPLEVTGPAVAA